MSWHQGRQDIQKKEQDGKSRFFQRFLRYFFEAMLQKSPYEPKIPKAIFDQSLEFLVVAQNRRRRANALSKTILEGAGNQPTKQLEDKCL